MISTEKLGLAIVAVSSVHTGVFAAPGPQPILSGTDGRAGMTCPERSHASAAAMYEMRENMLVPGAHIDLAKIMANPVLLAERKAEEDRRTSDWAFLCRYKEENVAARQSDTIFIGDSITENWLQADPSLFSGATLDRGIGGQTSSQILLRFYADVVALRPQVVHIMAGTNDIAGNGGPIADSDIVNNIRAMIDIARANGIAVVLASIPPASRIPWQANNYPAARIAAVNAQLRSLATERQVTFANYYSLLADNMGGLQSSLGNDGVHPNRRGYALMRPAAEAALNQAREARIHQTKSE